jgi:hypothetical protein
MSNFWYCEENGESVGPLTLIELKTRLSRALDASSVLVWREGMANWQRAGGVPDLNSSISAPQPPSRVRSSSQPGLPVRPGNSEGNEAHFPKNKSKSARFFYSLVIIALLGGGLRFLSEVNRTTASVDLTKLISGNARDTFVKTGETTCLKKQESDPDSKSLSISRERLSSYCSCYMNSLADKTTYGDLNAGLPKDGSIPPWLQSKIESADKTCTDQLHKGLLGG